MSIVCRKNDGRKPLRAGQSLPLWGSHWRPRMGLTGQEVSHVRMFSQKDHHRTGPQQEEHGWGSLVSGEEVSPECCEQRADR